MSFENYPKNIYHSDEYLFDYNDVILVSKRTFNSVKELTINLKYGTQAYLGEEVDVDRFLKGYVAAKALGLVVNAVDVL